MCGRDVIRRVRRRKTTVCCVAGLRLGRRRLWRAGARERSLADGGGDRRVDDHRSDSIRSFSNAEDGCAGRERLAALGRGRRVARRLLGGCTAVAVLHAVVARFGRCTVVHGTGSVHARHAEVEHRNSKRQGDESADHASQSKRSRVERKYAAGPTDPTGMSGTRHAVLFGRA